MKRRKRHVKFLLAEVRPNQIVSARHLQLFQGIEQGRCAGGEVANFDPKGPQPFATSRLRVAASSCRYSYEHCYTHSFLPYIRLQLSCVALMGRFTLARVALATLLGFGAGARGQQGIIRGVNLGGWLVTEPWMTPSLYSSTNTEDEWHLCNALGKQQCLSTLQNHWSYVSSYHVTAGGSVLIKTLGLSTRVMTSCR